MKVQIDIKKLFKILAYFIVLLFGLNFVATRLYWYVSIWWSDMVMHSLGGFCLGLAFMWFLLGKNSAFDLSFKLILKIILGVLFVGILWELFELYFINYVAENSFNVLDTVSDLFFDLAGGTFALFYLFFLFPKKVMPAKEITI